MIMQMKLSRMLPWECWRLYPAFLQSSEGNHLPSVAASLLTVQHSQNMWPIKWDYKEGIQVNRSSLRMRFAFSCRAPVFFSMVLHPHSLARDDFWVIPRV